MAFETTAAHEDIFSAIRRADRNLILSAVAGSGKTSTLIAGLSHIPAGKSVLFVVFNKKNAVEMQERIGDRFPNVTVMTLNALGHRAYCGMRGKLPVRVDGDKLRNVAKSIMAPQDFRLFSGTVVKLTRFAKAVGLIPAGVPGASPGLVPDTVETWSNLIDYFDLEIPESTTDVVVIDCARRVLKESLRTMDVIDFDDQLLMTFAFDAPLRKYDVVLADESQDMNMLQHELVARSLAPGGMLMAVGDENQSLYGFRGAASDSMMKLAERFNCVRLPLHVSYRCPQNVVKLAQQYVGHIQAHATAPMGTVLETRRDFREVEFHANEMVVCRTSAPLVQVAYSLLRKRVPCVILGKEIGQGLLSLVKRLKATDMASLLARLSAWEDKESQRFLLQEKEEQAAAVHDKADTIRIFAESVDNVPELELAISRMFDSQATQGMVVLCTIHKSKGLEADRVTILNFDDMPCRWAKQPWQQQQERNAVYVAVTRAKQHLQMAVVPRMSHK